MADKAITQMDAVTSVADADLLTTVVSPFGAGSNRKITWANIKASLLGMFGLPVGAIYITTVATNPNTVLGYGTWSAFGAGKVLVGLDSADANFDTVEETGGAKSQTTGQASAGATQRGTTASTLTLLAHTHSVSVLQPYIVVYMWKRTA